MCNTENYGNCQPDRKDYDLLTLVIIRLGDEVYQGRNESPGHDVLRFLHAVMYPHREGFLDTVKEYIDFSQNEKLWQEVDEMSGLGMSILQEGEKQGVTLSAAVFKEIQGGEQDNAVIAARCGCTEERVESIREVSGTAAGLFLCPDRSSLN